MRGRSARLSGTNGGESAIPGGKNMKLYKIITILCLHVLFAAVVGTFVAALICKQYVIASLCPAAYSVLKALWWADVEAVEWDE